MVKAANDVAGQLQGMKHIYSLVDYLLYGQVCLKCNGFVEHFSHNVLDKSKTDLFNGV